MREKPKYQHSKGLNYNLHAIKVDLLSQLMLYKCILGFYHSYTEKKKKKDTCQIPVDIFNSLEPQKHSKQKFGHGTKPPNPPAPHGLAQETSNPGCQAALPRKLQALLCITTIFLILL